MSTFEQEVASLYPKNALNRRNFIITALGSGFAAAVLPVSAATITTDSAGLEAGEVSIPVRDGHIPAYRAQPAGKTKLPIILVVQEIFGVHEHIKDLCRRLAKLGYLAVAPALYARQGDPSKFESIPELLDKVVSKVPDEEVMSDLDATAAWAGAHHGDESRMGVTGFCWGGRITWLYAAHNPKLKAGVAWYGPLAGPTNAMKPTNPVDIATQLKAPVLGQYGGLDQGITEANREQMHKALDSAKGVAAESTIIVYPDSPHGFNADYRPSYVKADAELAWQRMLDWFARYGVV
jgi:carboxymethylenebutenolidase